MSLVTVLFQKKVDKENDSAYVIRIEDWESANHQIIKSSLGFIIHLFHQLLMSLAILILPKKFGTYLSLGMLDRVVLATTTHANFIRFVRNQVSGILYIIVG